MRNMWGFRTNLRMLLSVIEKGEPFIDNAPIIRLYIIFAVLLMGHRDPIHCPSRASYLVCEASHPTWLPFLRQGMSNSQLGSKCQIRRVFQCAVWFSTCFLASSRFIVWSFWFFESAGEVDKRSTPSAQDTDAIGECSRHRSLRQAS